jgi:hypothetical protein
MLIFAILVAAAVGEDWQSAPALLTSTSARPLDELSQCFGEAWQQRSGLTSYIPKPRGFTMRLTYSVVGQPLVSARVDALDEGETRRLELRARKGDRGDKIQSEFQACAIGGK